MKKKICLFLALLASTLAVCGRDNAAAVTLTVTNNGNIPRNEVVEASLSDIYRMLDADGSCQLTVRNGLGQKVASQKSHDGKLLVYVSVLPSSKAVYKVSVGKADDRANIVCGRIYPERLDDLTWENDLGIYRIYGPALQRRGEKSYGIDVWIKNTPEPVAGERYRYHMWGAARGDSLRNAGRAEEAREIYMNTTFHLDHGNGMDCYSVGPTLGCGAPALMRGGKLEYPYCYRECKILDNGPLRFTAELVYNTTPHGITEHRIITLDRGSHYNRMTVWYEGISTPVSFATGVVLHGKENLVLGRNYVLYADPTDNPAVHQSYIFVGTLFPDGIDETVRHDGDNSHGLGIIKAYGGEKYTYYFGSAWSLYDVGTMAQWQLLADEYLYRISNPMTVECGLSE